jgi:hypothetical protein
MNHPIRDRIMHAANLKRPWQNARKLRGLAAPPGRSGLTAAILIIPFRSLRNMQASIRPVRNERVIKQT